jgi:hypothetical protein
MFFELQKYREILWDNMILISGINEYDHLSRR